MLKAPKQKKIRQIVKDIDPKTSILDIEGELLFKRVSKITTGGAVVEIGSWKGRSTLWLGFGAQSAWPGKVEVYSIDPHLGIKNIDESDTFEEFKKNIEIIRGFIIPLRQFSFNVVKEWNKKVKVLFIDGSHEYKDVLEDFVDWRRFLEEGSYIAFHDTIGYEGPRRVVIEEIFFSRYFRVVDIVGQVVGAYKVKKSILNLFWNIPILVFKYIYDWTFIIAELFPKNWKEWIKKI